MRIKIMQDNIVKKELIFGLILIFVGTAIPCTAINAIEKQSQPASNGNTLCVGGSGPSNYTKIQDAIDNASNGDTIFVYNDSSPYLETLLINKSINLIGEDKNTTIIDGNQGGPQGCNIEITADSVDISNFTFLNTKGYYEFSILKIHSNENQISNNIFNPTKYCRGIYIFYGDNNLITENIFFGIYNEGITLEYANNSIITKNSFKGENSGIVIYNSDNNIVSFNELLGTYFIGIYIRGKNNTILENSIWHTDDSTLAAGIKVSGKYKFDNNIILNNRIEYCRNGILMFDYSLNILENNISNCKYGIWLYNSEYSIVSKNNISENEEGLHISFGNYNIVTYNNITHNGIGINLCEGYKNKILNNNICWNKKDAKNSYCKRDKWNENYWGKTMIFPKILIGKGRIYLYTTMDVKGHPKDVYFYYPKINFDWHPAKEPYELDVVN